MTGHIAQVSVSRGGVPKRAIASGHLTLRGFDGDSWAHPKFHGGPDQAVLLIASEVLAILKAQNFPLYPGALGENLTTVGLDVRQWRLGQVFRAGSARLQLTKPRVPCRTIKIYGAQIGSAIYDSLVKAGDPASPLWGFSGMYARVLTAGIVNPGDRIALESEVA